MQEPAGRPGGQCCPWLEAARSRRCSGLLSTWQRLHGQGPDPVLQRVFCSAPHVRRGSAAEGTAAGKQVLAAEHAELLWVYMRRVGTEGTGQILKNISIPIAGKTG